MSRSLDFTACIKQDTCPVKDCWRKLTKEEKDWLEKTPNRMYYADFSNECEKLKKKPRMTCKKYCPIWNDIDKDCEIYGEHHLTPRTCPHYNKELKQDD
ncbi:MAG: hypothetical protein IJ529_01905 [Alphaproteobacteria bacterium]|nr:hypothetical protein [Alphaproteobacteria bacterium]MBR1600035.1 hypothetical protein [Alphaproteobacteria bacterium]